MHIESLKKAKEIILNALMNSKINGEDKADIMMTLVHLLSEENYDKNVKALRKIRWKK